MSTEIPRQLKKPQFKFCLLKPGTKKPFEPQWTTKANYVFADPKLINHISKGDNYGVMCGPGRMGILDVDTMSIVEELEKLLPKTFTVETGSGKRHYYFLVPAGTPKIILTKETIHYGELQGPGTQCVGPGSIHPVTKNVYKVIKDVDIAELPQSTINKLKELYTDMNADEPIVVTPPNWNNYSQLNLTNSLPITSVISTAGMKKTGSEYFGVHPTHGSTTGMNFFINPSKNLWHCFRCNSGGDALSLLAVKEGICDCSDFSGAGKKLRGKDFMDVLKVAQESYGLKLTDEEKDIIFNRKKPIAETNADPYRSNMLGRRDSLEIVNDTELDNLSIQDVEWLVQGLIPLKSFDFIAGKASSFKSMIAIDMMYCIAEGKPWKGKATRKSRCLYFNEENDWNTFAPMAKKLRRASIGKASPNVNYCTFNNVKFDEDAGIRMVQEAILKYKPEVLFLDSFKRFITFEENSADKVNEFYSRIIVPLRLKYDLTIISIHHAKKDVEGPNSQVKLDMLRGSSEFVNIADGVIYIRRKPGKDWVEFDQIKLRGAKESEKMTLAIYDKETEFGPGIEISDITKGETKPGEIVLRDCETDILNYVRSKKLQYFRMKELAENFAGIHSKGKLTEALKAFITDGTIFKPVAGQYAVNWEHQALVDSQIDDRVKTQQLDETLTMDDIEKINNSKSTNTLDKWTKRNEESKTKRETRSEEPKTEHEFEKELD